MYAVRFLLLATLLFAAAFLAGCKSVAVPPGSYLMTGNIHQRCLEILREGLHSDEYWPSVHAAESLIKAEYAFEATPVLQDRIRNERDKRRIAGYARALMPTNRNQAIVDLQDILLSDDIEARILAAEAMFKTASVGDPAILEQALDSLNNGRLRVFAAAALTVTDRGDLRSIIREALQGDDPAARYIAADVIPIVGNLDTDLPILADKKDLASSDFENLYFVRAMAIFGAASALKEVASYLKHPDPTIRSRAAFAVAETWQIDETDRLITLLDDPSLAVRVRAAQALLTLSNPTSPYRFLRLR